jgi:hypothetical protein
MSRMLVLACLWAASVVAPPSAIRRRPNGLVRHNSRRVEALKDVDDKKVDLGIIGAVTSGTVFLFSWLPTAVSKLPKLRVSLGTFIVAVAVSPIVKDWVARKWKTSVTENPVRLVRDALKDLKMKIPWGVPLEDLIERLGLTSTIQSYVIAPSRGCLLALSGLRTSGKSTAVAVALLG